MKVIVLVPVYNDWKSVSKLLNEIDFQTSCWDAEVSIIIVNDASTEKNFGLNSNFKKIKSIKILNMKENRVHQRCIATGLKYIFENEEFDYVIPMDADGEDRPEELNEFYKKSQENPGVTITGNRYKRSEGIMFKLLYEIHKLLTLIFTGKLIKFGNFTCLPKEHVKILIQKPYLWNSYSSSIIRAIKDRMHISSVRGTRYVLPSKMNFTALVFHSLTIISVFRNIFIFRSILFFLIYFYFIFNNINLFSLLPLILLLVFVFTVLKISMRSNLKSLNKALENIHNIDTLQNFNRRK